MALHSYGLYSYFHACFLDGTLPKAWCTACTRPSTGTECGSPSPPERCGNMCWSVCACICACVCDSKLLAGFLVFDGCQVIVL